MKTLLIKYAIILIIIHMPIVLNAQGRSQERPRRSIEAPGQNKNTTGVPIDGGSTALLAAGAAYGLKKLIDYRKQNKKAN